MRLRLDYERGAGGVVARGGISRALQRNLYLVEARGLGLLVNRDLILACLERNGARCNGRAVYVHMEAGERITSGEYAQFAGDAVAYPGVWDHIQALDNYFGVAQRGQAHYLHVYTAPC